MKCVLCGEMTSELSGDPGKWPVMLPTKNEPGVMKVHHMGCVLAAMDENETLRRELHKARTGGWNHARAEAALAREAEEKRARLAAEAREHALREALKGLISAISAHLARGEDTTPGDFERAWKCAHAALALKPGDALRALVEQVATMQRERDTLRDRLEPDPGGSDKIDELSDALMYARAEVERLTRERDEANSRLEAGADHRVPAVDEQRKAGK